MWSRQFESCIACGTAEAPHLARGLCISCYSRWLKERFRLGCWDGDGSVYGTDRRPREHPGASFVTGSRGFAEDMLKCLEGLGFPPRTLHKTRNVFQFRYSGANCALLGHVLYRNADASMWLDRNAKVFTAIAEAFNDSEISCAIARAECLRRGRRGY
jgi:hypothetical protein